MIIRMFFSFSAVLCFSTSCCDAQLYGHPIQSSYSVESSYATKLLSNSNIEIDCGREEFLPVSFRNDSLVIDCENFPIACQSISSKQYVDFRISFRGECRRVELPNLFFSKGRTLRISITKPIYNGIYRLVSLRRLFGRHVYTIWFIDPWIYNKNSFEPVISQACD